MKRKTIWTIVFFLLLIPLGLGVVVVDIGAGGGFLPGGWVGTAESDLNMNDYQITGATNISIDNCLHDRNSDARLCFEDGVVTSYG